MSGLENLQLLVIDVQRVRWVVDSKNPRQFSGDFFVVGETL